MDVFTETRTLLDDVNFLLSQIEQRKDELPESLNDPYNLAYMILDTLRYRDAVYSRYLASGIPHAEAMELTSKYLAAKSQELIDSTKPNVIPFRKKDK